MSDKTTPPELEQRLKEIEARYEATTDGRWTFESFPSGSRVVDMGTKIEGEYGDPLPASEINRHFIQIRQVLCDCCPAKDRHWVHGNHDDQEFHDLLFAAESHQDIPLLVSALREALATIDSQKLESEVDDFCNDPNLATDDELKLLDIANRLRSKLDETSAELERCHKASQLVRQERDLALATEALARELGEKTREFRWAYLRKNPPPTRWCLRFVPKEIEYGTISWGEDQRECIEQALELLKEEGES